MGVWMQKCVLILKIFDWKIDYPYKTDNQSCNIEWIIQSSIYSVSYNIYV